MPVWPIEGCSVFKYQVGVLAVTEARSALVTGSQFHEAHAGAHSHHHRYSPYAPSMPTPGWSISETGWCQLANPLSNWSFMPFMWQVLFAGCQRTTEFFHTLWPHPQICTLVYPPDLLVPSLWSILLMLLIKSQVIKMAHDSIYILISYFFLFTR